MLSESNESELTSKVRGTFNRFMPYVAVTQDHDYMFPVIDRDTGDGPICIKVNMALGTKPVFEAGFALVRNSVKVYQPPKFSESVEPALARALTKHFLGTLAFAADDIRYPKITTNVNKGDEDFYLDRQLKTIRNITDIKSDYYRHVSGQSEKAKQLIDANADFPELREVYEQEHAKHEANLRELKQKIQDKSLSDMMKEPETRDFLLKTLFKTDQDPTPPVFELNTTNPAQRALFQKELVLTEEERSAMVKLLSNKDFEVLGHVKTGMKR